MPKTRNGSKIELYNSHFAATLRALMEKTGMPLKPSEIGISVEDAVNAFIGARDARNKYMSCSLLWDLGLTDEFAEYLRETAEE